MRLRRGQIVAGTFLDHVQDGGSPIEFTVYGRLVSIAKTSLTIACWVYTSDQLKLDSNVTHFSLVRSCIRQIVHLKPEGA